MQTVIIVVHLMIVVALVITVLLQRSEGGALGVGGGGGFMTGRGQANALTRATAILAALFFATSIALTVMAGFTRAPKSIFETNPGGTPLTGPVAPRPGESGTVLDQLRKLDEQRQPGAPAPATAPNAPEAPKSQ